MNTQEAYNAAIKAGKRLPELEPLILEDVHCAYCYTRYVIEGCWKEAESIIATNSEYSYEYAKYIIKGKWKEGEAAIATNPFYAYKYANYVLKGRWKEGEVNMATSSYWAYEYAKDVLKWRIKGNKEFYISIINRWDDLPKNIKKCPDIMTAYFKEKVLK
jgi:hypothetical protein